MTDALSAAYTNPFEIESLDDIKYPEWCNPYARTYSSYVRGTLEVNTNGVGFVSMNPLFGAADDANAVPDNTTGSNLYFVLHSNSTGVGSTFNSDNDANGGGAAKESTTKFGDTIFSSADFGDTQSDNKFRVICAGLRVRYSGRDDEMNGSYYFVHRTSHETLMGLNASSLANFPETVIMPVDKEWHTVTAYPTQPKNSDWISGFDTADLASAGWEACLGCMIIDEEAGHNYEYEAICIFEVIGKDANSNVGPGPVVEIPSHPHALMPHMARVDAYGSKAAHLVQGSLATRLSRRAALEAASLGSGGGGIGAGGVARAIGETIGGPVGMLIGSRKSQRLAKKGWRKLKKIF
jgi:hypothetical protein